jgi:hypothetical protein
VQGERRVSNRDIARLLVWDPRKALHHAPHFIAPSAAGTPHAAKEA